MSADSIHRIPVEQIPDTSSSITLPKRVKRTSFLQGEKFSWTESNRKESDDKTQNVFAQMQRAESLKHLKKSASISPREEISPSTSPSDTVLGKFFAGSLFKRAESPSVGDSPRAWSFDISPTISWLVEHLPNKEPCLSIRILAYIATNYFYYVLPNKSSLGHVIFLSLQEENLIPPFFSYLIKIVSNHIDKTKKQRLLEMGLVLLSHPQMQPFLTYPEVQNATNYLLAATAQIDQASFQDFAAQVRYAVQNKDKLGPTLQELAERGFQAIRTWIVPQNDEENNLLYPPANLNPQIDLDIEIQKSFLHCLNHFVCQQSNAGRLNRDQEIQLMKEGLQIIIDLTAYRLLSSIEMHKMAENIIQKAHTLHSLTIPTLAKLAERAIIAPQISLKGLEFISLYLQEESLKSAEMLELVTGSRMFDPLGSLFPFSIAQIHVLNEIKMGKKKIYCDDLFKKFLSFAYYWKHCALNHTLASNPDFMKAWESVLPLLNKYPQPVISQELQYTTNSLPASHCIPYVKKENYFLNVHPIWQDPAGVQKLQDSLLLYLLESWEMTSIEDLLYDALSPHQVIKAHAGRCNQVVCFIGTQILLCTTYEQAFTILKMLNKVQKKLLINHAYEVAFAIHSALRLGPVASVCKPFVQDEKLSTLFSEQTCLFTFKGNAKTLRKIQEHNPHAFEVSAIIMKDLNSLKENIPDYIKKSVLNIEKLKQLGRIYHRTALAKNHFSYACRSKEIKVDDCIFSILKSQSRNSEEFLDEKYWKRAEEIHPLHSKKYWDR